MKVRLHWKLTFVFCATTVFIFAGMYFYLNTHLKTYIDSRIQGQLKRDLLLNKELIDEGMLQKFVPSNAGILADKIGKNLGVRATIIDPNGTVIGDSEIATDDLGRLDNHMTRVEVRGAIEKGFGQSRRFSTSIKKEMLYMAAPLGAPRFTGVLRLAIPLSDIELIESKVFKITSIAIALSVLATFWASFAVSVIVSRRLYEMSDVTKRLAMGDFSKKVISHSDDEIGDLAGAINHMAGEVERMVKKVSSEKVKLEAMLAGMFEGILLVDKNGNVILVNPSMRKLFFVDSDPEGKTPLEVFRNNQIQEAVTGLIGGGSRRVSLEIKTQQPDQMSIMMNGVTVTKGPSCEGAVLVFHDISELKRLEEIRKDFVANVSHELRTPISSIKGYAETLLDGKAEDKATVKDFLEMIHEDANRLASLIDDLLDLSRLESGRMEMDFEPLEILPIARRCFNVLRRSADDKSIAIKIDVPSGLAKVRGNEKLLAQVFLNLLDNAIKYTAPGGVITIHASPEDGAVRVDISDTGMGISEKDLPRIFERFYRVDKARSRESGGTGLGLSIVKHIIQAHDGQIRVQSKPGIGSTFSFSIPTA